MATYTHIIDAKGRVTVPARLRSGLDGPLYVTYSLDKGYLSGYSAERFSHIRDQIANLSGTNPTARLMERYIVGEAIPCEPDSQGRILISGDMWAHIGVKPGDEVCFTDMFEKIEICSKQVYLEKFDALQNLDPINLQAFDVQGL